jgi:hypothetical protein
VSRGEYLQDSTIDWCRYAPPRINRVYSRNFFENVKYLLPPTS